MSTIPKTLNRLTDGSVGHLPAQICECLDFYTHTEGWKTGLNDVILSKQEFFKSYMIMAGAIFNEENDLYVPHTPGTKTPCTQIGMNWSVNAADLNIFFARVSGAYGIPEKQP